MISLGIDIGTTSICAALYDGESKEQILARTISNDSYVKGLPWEHKQNPDRIIEVITELIEEMRPVRGKIDRIGITGQMHGILYVDKNGNAVSDLYTWEDERGNQPYKDGMSYSEYISELTGYQMPTGYGLTTVFYNMKNGLQPENACGVCTIMDYAAMKLCGLRKPLTHPTNAAGIGLFSIAGCEFDKEAADKAEIPLSVLPVIVPDERGIGYTDNNEMVVIPTGDNQAGTYALLTDPDDVLVNIGTSSQISRVSPDNEAPAGLECRPYFGGRYLHLYAGLCGGVSFAMLNSFFRQTMEMAGIDADKGELFDLMMMEAEKALEEEDELRVTTLFRGTRISPKERGSITNIGMNNFTPGQLTLGFYRGVCRELYEAYEKMNVDPEQGRLIMSGNALRRNRLLRDICSGMFGRQAILSEQKEEAASGAAKLALTA